MRSKTFLIWPAFLLFCLAPLFWVLLILWQSHGQWGKVALFLAGGAALCFIFARWLYRRFWAELKPLADGLRALSGGTTPPPILPDGSPKIKRISENYNSVLDTLERKNQALFNYEKQLEALNKIASLSELNVDDDKLEKEILKVVLESADLDHVLLYLQEEGEEWPQLKCVQSRVEMSGAQEKSNHLWEKLVRQVASGNQVVVIDRNRKNKNKDEEPESEGPQVCVAALPLSTQRRVRGVLVGLSSQFEYFSNQNLDLLFRLTRHLAVALENQKLYQNLRERLIEVTTFNQIGQMLSSILDLDKLLKQLLEVINTSFGYGVCAVLLYDKKSGQMISRAVYGYQGEIEKEGIHLQVPGPGLCNKVLQSGQPILCNDISSEPDYIEGWAKCQSELAVPLKSEDEVLGVLNVESEKANAFTEKDVRILSALAGQITILIQNARHFQKEREKTQQLLVTDQINRAIASTLNLEEIFGLVYKNLKEVIGCERMSIFFYRESREEFELAYLADREEKYSQPKFKVIPGRETDMDWVVKERKTFVCRELSPKICHNITREYLYQIGVRSYIVVPIIDQEKVTGCFNLVSRQPLKFGEGEVHIAETVANHLAVAIKNSQMYTELKIAYEEIKNTQETLIQSEKLRMLGEMASAVVHDFNNLLATILGRTQILQHSLAQVEIPTKGMWEKSLKTMEKAVSDAGLLLTRLSQFGKKGVKEDLEPVQLNEVVADVVEMTRPRWRDDSIRQGISVTVKTDLKTKSPIWGDAVGLREVLMNLVVNALDALPQGGEISFNSGDRGDQVWLSIGDNGTGMESETKQKIFTPFYTTKGKKGTGLGLAICLNIVTRMKGTIGVESDPGKGTVFTLTFPKYDEEMATRSATAVTEQERSLASAPDYRSLKHL